MSLCAALLLTPAIVSDLSADTLGTLSSVPVELSRDGNGAAMSPVTTATPRSSISANIDTVSSTPVEVADAPQPDQRWQFGTRGLDIDDGQAFGHSILLAQADETEGENDPLEPLNRVIFQFNEVVYMVLLDPIARTYNRVLPSKVRLVISNFLSNLASPVTFVNDLLQLEFDRAMTTLGRFVVNTTAGMGGAVDVAETIGLEQHGEDFGQTLGVYGVGEGFYLVLPLFGPSNPRDAVGRFLVDPYFDPVGLWLDNTDRDAERYSRIGVTALTEYAAVIDELDQLRRTSVDYYAAVRSLYRQRRDALISNGNDSGFPDIPNYDLNFAPPADRSVATTN